VNHPRRERTERKSKTFNGKKKGETQAAHWSPGGKTR